jgi:single-stranded-DNA-specific exonuclease
MINATQRMTKADNWAYFLIAKNKNDSIKWFEYIKSLNDARKDRQQTLLNYIEKYYKEYIKQPFIVIPGKFQKEYKGVLGVISGNLATSHNKPCIVLNYNANTKEYTGSGRSIGELNILDVLRDNPYIKNVGGHKQALGITIDEDKFNDFYLKLQEDIQKVPKEILEPKREIFGYIPINKINWDFFKAQEKFEPYGHKFPKPIFVTEGIIKAASLMGKNRNHLRLTITDEKGLVKFDCVKFFETEVPEKGKKYNVFFTFDKDDYKGGENIKLMIKDLERI